MNYLPSFLKKGDLILVVSPSGAVNKDLVLKGVELLEHAGLKVEIAPNTFNAHFKFGANHECRLSDLQFALDHEGAKAIYCARGGFGVTHIIDDLNWEIFKQNPKWIIGFSDITALLHTTYQNGFASLHASVLQGLPKLSKNHQKSVLESLMGNFHKLEGKNKYHKKGKAKGDLIGGNLSLLVHQIGTPSELDYSDKILFIEEVAESLYHIDRMIIQLKRAGKLKKLAGLVLGQFSDLTEDKAIYGQSVEEIILAHCEDYDFPIGFNFPFGHGEENMVLIHGTQIELTVENDVAKLNYLV